MQINPVVRIMSIEMGASVALDLRALSQKPPLPSIRGGYGY